MSDTSSDESELTASDRHLLLASDRRRLTLDVLTGTTDPVDLEELAAGIAAREDGIDATDEVIEHAKIELHHNHLPRLAEAGLIGYDDEDNTVDPSPLADVQLDVNFDTGSDES